MKLFTKEVRDLAKKYPLYSQENKGDEAIVWVKFFMPSSRYTLYVTEMDIEKIVALGNRQIAEGSAFGYVLSPFGEDCDELGYADLEELTTVKGKFGLSLERDMYFTSTTIGEIKAGKGR